MNNDSKTAKESLYETNTSDFKRTLNYNETKQKEIYPKYVSNFPRFDPTKSFYEV